MKIQKSEIAPKLAALKSVALSKGCANAVQGVLFQDNKLTAYDLTIGLTAMLGTNTDEQFIIPPKAIEMIEKFPNGEIEIAGDDKTIMLKADGPKSKYVTFSVADYPEIYAVKNTKSVSLDGDKLQDCIVHVLYSVPDSSLNPVQTGMLLEATSGALHIVACDGVRLAHSWMPYDGEFNLVVPKASMQKLLSIGLSGPVEITYASNKAVFKSAEYTMFTRLLEGEFVDYNAAVPNNTNIVEIDRKSLINSLGRAALCIDGNNMVPIAMSFEGSELRMKADSPIMEYSDTLLLENSIKEPVTLGINAKYLLDALKSFDGDIVKIALGGASMPLVISEVDTIAMIMPAILKGEQP